VDCYSWYSEEGTGRGPNPPKPLLAVSYLTAHPSTASVPITVALRFNVPIKGLTNATIRGRVTSGGFSREGVISGGDVSKEVSSRGVVKHSIRKACCLSVAAAAQQSKRVSFFLKLEVDLVILCVLNDRQQASSRTLSG